MKPEIQLDLIRGKVVTASHDVADIIQLEDGLWYYWQRDGKALAPWALRAIADLLDEVNREWEEKLEVAYKAIPDDHQH
jgi:hypothetical protein